MSKTVVLKFGGTSVGSVERIGSVAKRVVSSMRQDGARVVVVVSAMSGETDRLIELSRKIMDRRGRDREYHQLLASGEQVSAALTAMAIGREGVRAASLLAHQLPQQTSHTGGQHLIKQVNTGRIERLLDAGIVPVIAGFQGVDENGDFTTLGRGGSDTTAVAVAAALGPCRCYILTDVDGVYTAQPSICKRARKLKQLTYEEMLELASSGAKVLQARSVSLARKHQVPLVVSSSFHNGEGTEIVKEYEGMEDAVVSGITCRTDEAKITLRNLPDRPGVAAKIFKALGDAGIVVDMIVQGQGMGGRADISFTVPEESTDHAAESLSDVLRESIRYIR